MKEKQYFRKKVMPENNIYYATLKQDTVTGA